MKVKNPVFLNAAKDKALPAGHPDAATLLVGANGTVTKAIADRYNLTENGAPDQPKRAEVKPAVPHMVNKNTPDGINTAPGTEAATPSPSAPAPAAPAPAPAAPPAPASAQPATETPAKPAKAAPAPAKAKDKAKDAKAKDPLKEAAKRRGR